MKANEQNVLWKEVHQINSANIHFRLSMLLAHYFLKHSIYLLALFAWSSPSSHVVLSYNVTTLNIASSILFESLHENVATTNFLIF